MCSATYQCVRHKHIYTTSSTTTCAAFKYHSNTWCTQTRVHTTSYLFIVEGKKKRFKRFRRKKKVKESRPREVHCNDPFKNSTGNFAINSIKTTKYTLITFLPKNLFEQVCSQGQSAMWMLLGCKHCNRLTLRYFSLEE